MMSRGKERTGKGKTNGQSLHLGLSSFDGNLQQKFVRVCERTMTGMAVVVPSSTRASVWLYELCLWLSSDEILL